MLREEEKDQGSSVSWKTFSRSVSWTERPLRKSNSNSQWNSKVRACLSPLQPLSIAQPSIEEWPRARSDDLGVWPDPPTPGARPGSKTPHGTSSSDLPPREFKCRKAKLAFFDKECSRILDHIYLGSDVIAKNREILRQRGITHVLNCVGFVCPEYFRNELMYKTLWLQDSPSEDITSILYDVFDYFEDIREQGGRVLVHCCHGVSRSTSLVIPYLMWKEGHSFDDAFQHVKTARGVTNPNMGFACQLLQCQKNVHALPASPTSVLRMYRMAPHSPYDPLHLVLKMLCEVEAGSRLDSRGAFIVHSPSALYIWIGKHCTSVMSDNVGADASQIIRYERVKGPIIFIKEGEEMFEFWDAFSHRKGLAEGCHVKPVEIKGLSAGVDMTTVVPCLNQRKVDGYDLDFDIFHMALAGGVIPPYPSSEAGFETCIPSRENGWNSLRSKFTDGITKEFATDSGVSQRFDKVEPVDACSVDACSVKDTLSSTDILSSSSMKNDSQDSFASCVSSSLGSDTSLVESPPLNLVDSFSSFFVSKPKSNSMSPSISSSTSDYSSSFSFSPLSSNFSDLSFVSAQPSPRTLESSDNDHGEATFPCHVSRAAGLCSSSGQSLPSLAERRGSSLPSQMILASIGEESHISENLPRFLEVGAVKDIDCENSHPSVSLESTKEEPIRDANGHVADGDCPTTSPAAKKV
ncbi:protein-tyrosine-phosphatase MKP1-like [Salvia divinorum]|uniref:Protein-tyrosine-phosphatase MKP1-like n=1 Tax=Salvia divinorum TaxID=28513 RepID=A0ABD1G598_SALDI